LLLPKPGARSSRARLPLEESPPIRKR
jgi:hypothetical protein